MKTAGSISSFVFALVIASACAQSAPEPFFEGLGSYTRKVTTGSPEAQKYFDQGLNFLFGFNHGAAIRAFQAAEKADPTCGMAYWGVALACGPHINFPHVPPPAAELAWKELTLAQENVANASAVENALIEALGHRYANPQPEDRSPLDRAYADAMRAVWKAHSEDPDVGALFAEAMMDLRPWDQWTPDGHPEPGSEEILATLAAVAENFVGLPYEVLVRFGRWDDILAAPDHPDFMPLTRAMRLAARGIAFAAKGDVAAAKAEQQAYLAAVPLVPPEETAGPNTGQAILAVVTPMLAGEILYRDGKVDEGLSKLREAVKAEDALRYSEPPGWILPARHSLGAALMQERSFAEAEPVYRDDLARLPENGWALFGLAQSLHSQGKEEEAAATDTRFRKIWSKADVQITSSCLCQPGA